MKLKMIRLVNKSSDGYYRVTGEGVEVHRVYDTDEFGNLVSVDFRLHGDGRMFNLVNVNQGQIYVKTKAVK